MILIKNNKICWGSNLLFIRLFQTCKSLNYMGKIAATGFVFSLQFIYPLLWFKN